MDHLRLGEAELTLPEFFGDLERGEPRRCYEAGSFAKLESSPCPAHEMVDRSRYLCFSLQYSRGCPNQCDFCDI